MPGYSYAKLRKGFLPKPATGINGEEWFPVSKAAKRAGISRQTIYVYAMKGKIRAVRLKGTLHVHFSDVLSAKRGTPPGRNAQIVSRCAVK